MDKTDIFKDPFALLNLYANGKGTLWKTNAEAAKFISKNGFKIAPSQLKRLTVLLQCPDEIINLFSVTGINSQTGRRLGTARKKYGLEELLKKAKDLTPARNPEERSNILAVLKGETLRAVAMDLLPVEMARILFTMKGCTRTGGLIRDKRVYKLGWVKNYIKRLRS